MLPGALNCVLEVDSIVFPGALNSSSQLPAALDSRECPRFEKHMFSCRSRTVLRIHDLGACPYRAYRVIILRLTSILIILQLMELSWVDVGVDGIPFV